MNLKYLGYKSRPIAAVIYLITSTACFAEGLPVLSSEEILIENEKAGAAELLTDLETLAMTDIPTSIDLLPPEEPQSLNSSQNQGLNQRMMRVGFQPTPYRNKPGVFSPFTRWIRQKKQEVRTIRVMARMRVLKATSEKIVQTEKAWLQEFERGDQKNPALPTGEWEKRSIELNPSVGETSLSAPSVIEFHRARKENHERRLVGFQLLQEALDTVPLDDLNLILRNAQLPPVEEVVDLEDPVRLQEEVAFMIQVLKPMGLSSR